MSNQPDPPPDSNRPWWAGSARGWDSPWDLDDPVEGPPPAQQPVVQPAQQPIPQPMDHVEINPIAAQFEQRVVPNATAKVVIKPAPTSQGESGVGAEGGSGRAPGSQGHDSESSVGFQEEGHQAGGGGFQGRGKGPRSVGWGRLTVLAVLVFAMTFAAWLYLTDVSVVDDGDLRMHAPADATVSISAPQRLEAFLDSVKPMTTSAVGGAEAWEWDVNDMRVMLDRNGLALDNLKDLLEDESWRGRHVSWHFKDLGSHPNWERAVLLKQVEVAYNDRLGNEAAALAAAMDLAELARRLQDLYAWPSYYFQSLEIHRRCAESLAESLQYSRLPAVDLAGFQEQFEVCMPNDAQVRRNILPAFYLFEKKVLLGMQSGEPFEAMPTGVVRSQQRRLFFKSNETLDLIAGSIRYLINQVGQTSASSAGLREMWAREPVGQGFNAYLPNGQGVAFAQERLQPYLDVPARQQLAKTRHLLVLQLLAMRRFIADHKGLPSKLSDLRPNYLAELPNDPFSGVAFQYDPTTRVIFSVGSDYVASGGRANRPPLSDPGEPTVKIGVRTASTDR